VRAKAAARHSKKGFFSRGESAFSFAEVGRISSVMQRLSLRKPIFLEFRLPWRRSGSHLAPALKGFSALASGARKGSDKKMVEEEKGEGNARLGENGRCTKRRDLIRRRVEMNSAYSSSPGIVWLMLMLINMAREGEISSSSLRLQTAVLLICVSACRLDPWVDGGALGRSGVALFFSPFPLP